MKKKVLTTVLALVLGTSLAACGSTSSGNNTSDSAAKSTSAEASGTTTGKKGKYDLKFSLEVSEDNFQAKAWKAWCDKITEKTNGEVTFTMYYDGTLLDATQEYKQLTAGAADIADVHRFANDGFKISEHWKSFTAGIPDGSQTWMSYQLWDNYPALQDEYKGVKVLAQAFNGGTTYDLLTVDKKVQSPADMKGMTIWCEADWNGFVKACGATPVNTPFTEVYSSLQKHMYDGMMIAAETLKSVNFAEVCKYCIDLNLNYASAPGHLMNLDTWNSLPKDVQEIIDSKEMTDFVENANHEGFKETTEEALEWAKKTYGTEEVVLDDAAHDEFVKLVQQANVATAEELDSEGLPGTQMLDSLAQWSEEFEEDGGGEAVSAVSSAS